MKNWRFITADAGLDRIILGLCILGICDAIKEFIWMSGIIVGGHAITTWMFWLGFGVAVALVMICVLGEVVEMTGDPNRSAAVILALIGAVMGNIFLDTSPWKWLVWGLVWVFVSLIAACLVGTFIRRMGGEDRE